ncbi:hypothetical protein Vsou_24860 [Vulcanisaeta souniana JCM 11219]|uniref:Uncharacterized protein n=1 Tax=Vulcanisaeta souniana JCM 11219 TaxID=1293586 RepID=A0A830EHD8_9CREN|nr:hypothetical protein Vsou_24860 [Vulcanisaeta souniana JCM 11219]GGI76825.1 hypothetical protein GCM10007112_11990 [Vulcanisaeta souniana JCM 11219]
MKITMRVNDYLRVIQPLGLRFITRELIRRILKISYYYKDLRIFTEQDFKVLMKY